MTRQSVQSTRLMEMAVKLRRLERAYQVAIDTEKRNALEHAVEMGEMDEYAMKDKLNSAKSAWKEANKMFANINMKALSATDGPHQEYVWESAANWVMCSAIAEEADFVVPYLEIFGYLPTGTAAWVATPPAPQLALQLKPCAEGAAHEEHGGHTWYNIECRMFGLAEAAMLLQGFTPEALQETPPELSVEQRELCWRAPRRLSQLRENLHDPIKAFLGADYAKHFGETPFAHHGGVPGTTARVGAWLATLVALVNSGGLPPSMVARTLVFLRGPPVPEQQAAADAASAAEAAAENRVNAGEGQGDLDEADKALAEPEELAALGVVL